MQASKNPVNTKPTKDADCRIDIQIESHGDVNIYNCTAPQRDREPCPPSPKQECPPRPIAPGQCVPLALGAKPKQSQRRKLQKLLDENRVPSAIAASFFHVSRRFLAGHSPASPFEENAFGVLRSLSPDVKGLLSCSLASFDALPPGERDRLFDSTLPTDPNVPIDMDILTAAVDREVTQRTSLVVFDDPNGFEQERPGQNRFFAPEGEFFDVQLRICTINGLRTNEFAPALAAGDYLPSELQHICEPILVNGEVQPNCRVQTDNCPGNFLTGGTCLRVPEVRPGEAVVLQGVNFISVDATVRLAAQEPGTVTREVDAHVVGDIDTPLTEVVDDVIVPIRDCRVHDRLTFQIPDDLPPGTYSFQVAVPNVSGIPVLGDPILSSLQYLRVVPPSTARFEIHSEKLRAGQETSPASFGSDEVRVRVRAYPITGGMDQLILGEEQAFDSPEFGDMDSGTTRPMEALLFSHQAPIDGIIMMIMGHEIDSETAYEEQIDSFTEAFYHYLKIALAAIGAGVVAGGFAIGIKDLLKLGLKHWLIVVIAAVVVLVVILFLAAWAPADTIIDDAIGFTALDLAMLTSANFPAPANVGYVSQSGIKVTLTTLSKTATEYRERREYRSDAEDSRYEIELRYNRVA